MSEQIKTWQERMLGKGAFGNDSVFMKQEIAELRARAQADAKLIAEQNRLAKERQEWALHTNQVIRDLRAAIELAQAPSAPVAPDERALLAARAEGRAEAVLMIMAEDPEDCLNDCMVGSGPCPASGEYDTHWDEEKLRAKFKTGDNTINMETKAELAYYEYLGARMELEYEADQRRAALSVKAGAAASAEEIRKRLMFAAIDCGHSIAEDRITLHRDKAKEGNALHQLVERIVLAAAPTPPTTGEA